MLVQFCKGFTMEGESTVKTYKHWWSRGKKVRQKIYLHTWVSGICDEADVEKEVERLIAKELKHSGWGKDFTGWQKALTAAELLEVAEEKGWDTSELCTTDKIRTEPVNQWKMEKIMKELTGAQFAQFCRENEISMKEFYRG